MRLDEDGFTADRLDPLDAVVTASAAGCAETGTIFLIRSAPGRPRQGSSSQSAPTAASSPAASSQLASRVRPFLLNSIIAPHRMSASP